MKNRIGVEDVAMTVTLIDAIEQDVRNTLLDAVNAEEVYNIESTLKTIAQLREVTTNIFNKSSKSARYMTFDSCSECVENYGLEDMVEEER